MLRSKCSMCSNRNELVTAAQIRNIVMDENGIITNLQYFLLETGQQPEAY